MVLSWLVFTHDLPAEQLSRSSLPHTVFSCCLNAQSDVMYQYMYIVEMAMWMNMTHRIMLQVHVQRDRKELEVAACYMNHRRSRSDPSPRSTPSASVHHAIVLLYASQFYSSPIVIFFRFFLLPQQESSLYFTAKTELCTWAFLYFCVVKCPILAAWQNSMTGDAMAFIR